MIRDYHTHSTASDGSLSPLELLDTAIANGVSELAITDHDTLAGYREVVRQLEREPKTESLRRSIRLIPGVELSARWGGLGIHIVGLQVDIDHTLLRQAMEEQQSVRSLRAEEIARRLEKAGISNALEGAQRYMQGKQLGRPHFAEYLVAQGYVKNRQAAFKKYLGTGKIGDVKNVWPEMERVIEWIDLSGGIAVLAHPMQYKVTNRRLALLVEAFAEAGGKAVEIAVPGASAQDMQRLVRLASEHDLLASQGSDFHASAGKWQQVGRMPILPKEAIPVWEYWQ